MIQKCRHILFIVLYCLGGSFAYSQNYEVDTTGIREVVSSWNKAHNQINEDTFNELYAPTVLFYANYLDKKVCLEKKLSLLSKRPFAQRIVSNLQLAFYEGGIVYCGFTKEVSTGKGKKSYPSYLLLKRFGDHYLITGESDLVTDRNLKFHLSLGPQIQISELSASPPKGSKFKSVYGLAVLFLLISVAGVAIYFFRRRPVINADLAKFHKKPKVSRYPTRIIWTRKRYTPTCWCALKENYLRKQALVKSNWRKATRLSNLLLPDLNRGVMSSNGWMQPVTKARKATTLRQIKTRISNTNFAWVVSPIHFPLSVNFVL